MKTFPVTRGLVSIVARWKVVRWKVAGWKPPTSVGGAGSLEPAKIEVVNSSGFSRGEKHRGRLYATCIKTPGITCLALLILICAATPFVIHTLADTRPNVQLNVDNVKPHALEDTTQKAILRDYTAAWQAINTAFANSTTAPLNDNFAGFALEKLTQRVKDQKTQGLRTRIIDHGHHVDAIFYARDGSAVELRDTANLETQVLDGDTILHSDKSQVQYIAVMTGAADRWQVRVLESVPSGQ